MAAGVGDRDVLAGVVGGPRRAGVRQAGVLGHGQGVDVGAQQHGRPVAVGQRGDDAGAADAPGHVVAQRLQTVGHDAGRPVLLEGQLGVGVQVLVEVLQVGQQVRHRRGHGTPPRSGSRTVPTAARPDDDPARRSRRGGGGGQSWPGLALSATGTYSGSDSSRIENRHLQHTSSSSLRGGMAKMSTFMFGS